MGFDIVVPFEPVMAAELPSGGRWIAQIKWDGVRMLTYYDGNRTELVNRRGNNRTRQYPELADATAFCSADSVILDGEIIALHEGKPSFHEVMRRDSVRTEASIPAAMRQVPVLYMVFDLLYLNGRWVTELPLRERQALLAEVLRPHPSVQAVPSYPDPAGLFASAVEHGLEGIVCKDPDSAYAIGGKDRRWIKRKIISDLNAVAGGVTFRDGIVNAILLGLYGKDGRLHYIGHAGTGRLTVADWRALTERALKLGTQEMPFAELPQRRQGAFWIRPELVFKIHFLEWTPSGTLRQPSIQAEVQVAPQDCILERERTR